MSEVYFANVGAGLTVYLQSCVIRVLNKLRNAEDRVNSQVLFLKHTMTFIFNMSNV